MRCSGRGWLINHAGIARVCAILRVREPPTAKQPESLQTGIWDVLREELDARLRPELDPEVLR